MSKYIVFSFKNHFLLRFSLFFVIILLQSSAILAQCNCELITHEPSSCKEERVLSFKHKENITEELRAAILEKCRVIISNENAISSDSNTSGNITLYVSPMTFSNIQNKEIILEQGVTLQGIEGGYSDCSQSVFTFEGTNVENIIIRGEYDICDGGDKPTIRASKPDILEVLTEGYLVASDNDGEPYLNDNGEPNYIFSDGDINPYFDNNGKPNFIGSGNEPKVEASCDYNDYICNRDIIVWCPFSLEGRHLISIQGSNNFTIDNIKMIKSAGGDAVHITDDRDFNPAQVVNINRVDFYKNARTGVVFANAKCSTIDSSTFEKNGLYMPEDVVERRGAIAFHQNSNIGSITPYYGKIPMWTQWINRVYNSTFTNNNGHEFSFDLPLTLNHCSNNANIAIIDNCVTETDNVLAFKALSNDQDGIIRFTNFTVNDYLSTMITVENDWENNGLDHRFINVTSETSTSPQDVYQINNQSFCQNLFVADWCQTNSTEQLCGQTYNCNSNQNYTCLEPEICCELYTTIEAIEGQVICECDFLFVVDESTSVSDDDWNDMECTIYDIMTDLNLLCEDISICNSEEQNSFDQNCVDSVNALVRFALVQWSETNSQNIYSDFVNDPFHFEREFFGGTNLYKALEFVNESINSGDLNPKTRNGGKLDKTKCLKTIILTDAPCDKFNLLAQEQAQLLSTNSNTSIDVVDYTPGNEYPNCSNNGPNNTAIDGSIYDASFDCDASGFSAEDIAEYDNNYVITVHYEHCEFPIVSWSISNGEILESNADSTQITVTGSGVYTATILCETGCSGIVEVFDLGNITQNPLGLRVSSSPSYIDRNVLIDGEWYTPHQRELLHTSILENNAEVPVVLYPNPSNGKITFENPFIKNGGSYEIIDLQGRNIDQGKFNANENLIEVNFKNVSEGVLFLKLTRENDGYINYTRFVYQK